MASNKLHQLRQYLNYWLYALGRHSLQSPFVFDIYEHIHSPLIHSESFDNIEQLRQALASSSKTIEVDDFGAGSQISSSRIKKISQLATTGSTPKKNHILLRKLAEYLNAKSILELGTSLGLSTAHLATSHSKVEKVYSFEGASTLAHLAKDNFQMLDIKNIEVIEGNIDVTLPAAISKGNIKSIDLAYLDANHTYEATVQYFNQLLSITHKHTCIVIDDIHWSKDMTAAWQQILSSPHVSISMDLYQLGIVFLNPELTKQHYMLEY